MSKKNFLWAFGLALISISSVKAQTVLTLKEAVSQAVTHYGSIRAKGHYAKASKELAEQAKRDYLPNFNIGLQQDYGTINGQNGPLYGFGGLAAASSGLPLPEQNWHAAFGALYLTNINWDFFTFGRAQQKIKVAETMAERDQKDWQQEIFQQQIKVTAAYLNLLAAHQISFSYKRNMERADTLRRIVQTRSINGLVAGVDSSLANADYSSARILYIRAQDTEQQLKNELLQLMQGDETIKDFLLDTSMLARLPLLDIAATDSSNHPLLQFLKSRINVSDEQSKLIKRSYYPAFTLVGLLQTRGSGFESSYATNQDHFTRNYFEGIKPTRTNYLFGVGVTWNLTQPYRLSKQFAAQQLISKGLTEEYEQAGRQLKWQQQLAETRKRNALAVYREAPIQVKAASDAYLQKSVLYKNGLTNLVDVTQAAYALIRAETDREVAVNNIWQALLLQAAASGDYRFFDSQL